MANRKIGAEIFWESLIRQGVEVVFGYPGAATLPLYGALDNYQGRIRHVLTRHEQAATQMADGFARASGQVGVVMATSGPGATNMVGAIATAMRDASPMVCISGQVTTTAIGSDAFQEVDMIDITEPITKHNYLVNTTAELAETIDNAFHIARTGRPGPVLVDIPKDTLTDTIAFERAAKPIDRPSYEPDEVGRKINPDANIIHHSLPAAIGASFHMKDEEIWVVERNDSIQMPIAELATLAQEQANIKIIAVNSPANKDGITQNIVAAPVQPNYFKLAQAYGMPGYRIKKIGDVLPVIHLARAQRGPVLIESTVEIHDLYAMLSAHPVLHQIFRRLYTPMPRANRHQFNKLVKLHD